VALADNLTEARIKAFRLLEKPLGKLGGVGRVSLDFHNSSNKVATAAV
jgi:hypothetical protein